MTDQHLKAATEAALKRAAELDMRRPKASSAAARWHIVRAVAKSDARVLEWLKRLDVETYYPQFIEMRKVSKYKLSAKQRLAGVVIKRPMAVPMFPRYVFMRCDLSTGFWREMSKVAGIGGMLCEGDLPVYVTDELIAKLRDKEAAGSIVGEASMRVVFDVGEEVRIGDGVFFGHKAVVEEAIDLPIEEVDPDTRIKVAISLFGRPASLELELRQVDKV